MTTKEIRRLVKKKFPNLSRKEFRQFCFQGEAKILELVAARDVKYEEECKVAEAQYRAKREQEARDNEEPIVKFMRAIVAIKEGGTPDVSCLDGTAFEFKTAGAP